MSWIVALLWLTSGIILGVWASGRVVVHAIFRIAAFRRLVLDYLIDEFGREILELFEERCGGVARDAATAEEAD